MGIYTRSKGNNSIGCLSDKGNVREINEDYVDFYISDDFQLYVIADGMGGHNAGEIASGMAVDSCINFMKELRQINNPVEVLKDAIMYANRTVYNESNKINNLRGMGTTITACLVKDNDIIIANVGDSSCFIIDENGIEKITKDHSLVQQLVDDGSITEEEAINHPNKNIITRALGTKENIDIDIFKKKINEVKKVLLCTDGLTNEVDKKEIYDIMANSDNEEASKLLVELGKFKGGRDNISVLIFEGEC